MASHNHHHSTTTPCCCHPQPPQQPPIDPILISTIITQLQLQNPIKAHHFHPHSHSPPLIASLIRRLDHLETSLTHQFSSFSSSSKYPPFYLKDAAARVIQTRFRVFLVRRSRTLAHLKDLANVKSTFLSLKSLVSINNININRRGFVDFDCVSRDAMDLLLLLDFIKGEDKMIRDSKKSITREIIQFLELIDGLCLKRHQVMTRKIRTMRVVRKDKGTSGYDIRGYSDRASGSKSRNVGNEEKKLIANLRERVERIGKMSRVLEEEEDEDEVEDTDSEIYSQDDGGNFNHIRTKHGLNNGLGINKRTQHGVGSKGQNVDYEGKKTISNLKGRVERIGKLSRALEEAEENEEEEEEVEVTDDESEGYEHLGDDNGGNFNHIRSKHGPNNAVSNSKRTTHHVGGSKGENVDDEGKRMIANLKERVVRIAKMSRALEEEELVDEETEGIEYHGEEDGGNYNHIKSKGDPSKGVTINKSMPHSSGKRVCFVEDENMTKGIQDSTTARQDEAEAPSDEEQSTQSSEVDGDNSHDKEFTFPAPEVPKRKSGVKITG